MLGHTLLVPSSSQTPGSACHSLLFQLVCFICRFLHFHHYLQESEIALREVRLLQLARHRNVVNLLEAYRSQSGRLYLVFEYVERSLLQDLKACKQGLHVNLVKSITWQLLQSLSYLHRKKVRHAATMSDAARTL